MKQKIQPETQSTNRRDKNTAHNPLRLAALVYLLFFLGILFGITALIGVIINHTHFAQTKGSIASSHFRLQIISFWGLFCALTASFMWWPGNAAMALVTGSLLWWAITALCGSWLLAKKRAVPLLTAPVLGK